MRDFFKIKTQNKILISFTIMIIATILFAATSYRNHSRMNEVILKNTHLDSITYELTGLRADEHMLRANSLELLYEPSRISDTSIVNKISRKQTDIMQKTKGIDSMLISYPEQRLLMHDLTRDVSTYVNNREIMLKHIKDNKIDEAHQIVDMYQNSLYNHIREKSITIETQLLNIKNITDKLYHKREQMVVLQLIVLGSILILLVIITSFWSLSVLKNLSTEIKSGIEVLETVSNDIITAVTDISTGAAETTTAVTETTTTIEEVRQTAMVSNHKALSLMESSQKAADSAEKGKESVLKLSDAIHNISNHMKLISETVIKLVEKNRAIAEITSSVADIADQSNLLAVNAAIEAAKAGEHGRGFTVVAQEIRSLADQSKKATLQVKDILNEVEKSVHTTLGVTEQGSNIVNEGINRLVESSDVIDILSKNVDDAVEAVIQISSSTRQQMAGMEQIVPAMTNIKKASEQNVIGINHTQKTAEKIYKLGTSLKNIILKYKL